MGKSATARNARFETLTISHLAPPSSQVSPCAHSYTAAAETLPIMAAIAIATTSTRGMAPS